ncbi:SDR family NAD(P)-dependent oxidoreductase [Pseudomonas sp. KHB2.9]
MQNKITQVILLTGAASGIGAASAKLAISLGYSVMLADINFKGATALAASLGEKASAVSLDICSAQQWQRAIDATFEKFGQLDILINNAAIVCPGYARDVALEHHQRTLDTNFMGPLTGTLAVLERFTRQGHGHIVTVCSMTAFIPFPGIASYGASKHALRAFHHALALEERHGPVNFTIVHPTSTETPMLEQEAQHDASSFAFASESVTPEFVAETLFKAIKKKTVEVFMPPEQARAVRMLGTDPKKMRSLFDTMEQIGRQAQQTRRAEAGL